ncbi:MAG: cytochrome c biogenesis protein ResB [Dehalococcoidia bacterium]
MSAARQSTMQGGDSRLAEPSGLDPLRTIWNLLTNVKFALFLVGLALLAGLVGTILPQVPGPMRGNPAARAAWMGLREETYGSFTAPMDSLQLFDVFHSTWFNGLWILIIVAVTVCTVSRFRPTWRSVQRPALTVSDSYFERAHHRASFTHTGGPAAVESLLRKRHYKVVHAQERDGATYLFADRFGWSQYGTFLSHLALLMLLIGALLTTMAGFNRTYIFAEGAPEAALFDKPGPNQLFITVNDAYRGLDADNNVVDYYSLIEVRRGDEVKTCKTTVNDPCRAFGYKIHQAAWFNDIAALRITNADGRVVFDSNVDFESERTAVPAFLVTDSMGQKLFEGVLPQMGTDPGDPSTRSDDYATATLVFPSEPGADTGPAYEVAWRIIDGKMSLLLAGNDVNPTTLAPGESVLSGGYRIAFTSAVSIPAIQVLDMPGATSDAGVTVQMPTTADGTPYLYVAGIADDNVILGKNRPVKGVNGYTYTFGGQIEASGMSVRRDPGDTFIWVAVGMAVIGLAITFYVPRRRLWVKVTPARTYMAGIAEKTTRLGREMRLMGAALGAQDALREEDLRPLD